MVPCPTLTLKFSSVITLLTLVVSDWTKEDGPDNQILNNSRKNYLYVNKDIGPYRHLDASHPKPSHSVVLSVSLIFL